MAAANSPKTAGENAGGQTVNICISRLFWNHFPGRGITGYPYGVMGKMSNLRRIANYRKKDGNKRLTKTQWSYMRLL